MDLVSSPSSNHFGTGLELASTLATVGHEATLIIPLLNIISDAYFEFLLRWFLASGSACQSLQLSEKQLTLILENEVLRQVVNIVRIDNTEITAAPGEQPNLNKPNEDISRGP